MAQSAGKLELILRDVERALDAQLWYAALSVSLSLPDVCSLLERPANEGWSKGWKYAAWFDHNLKQYLPLFTGDDCYKLRGGVLHKGQLRKDDARWDHIAFTTPESDMRLHLTLSENNSGVEESALILDVEMFCSDMMRAVRRWFDESSENPHLRENLAYVVALSSDDIGAQISGLGALR